MPEPNFLSMYSFSSEPPKKSPVIKLSCGIGDTDGFPAFDVDSDVYATKDDSRWGFLITGGADFHMPLTVFQVTPDSLADKGGIRLGDVILEINEEDATNLTLAEAHQKIDATPKKIFFIVKSMEEDPMEEFEVGEEKSIVLRIPKPMPPPKVASIEKRLRDMQRKLSEIAEIPKILSSTLATVSQTFDKLAMNAPVPTRYADSKSGDNQQKRKMSYDEDAYDYELSDDDNDGDNDELADDQFNAKETYLRLKQHIARQRKSKDVTPESDYASENNYNPNGQEGPSDDDDDDDDDDDNNENYDDIIDNHHDINDDDYRKMKPQEFNESEEQTDEENGNEDICQEFNLKLFLTPSGDNNNSDNKTSWMTDNEMKAMSDDDEDEEDFLTTTFTMNLRNKPKFQINDGDNHIKMTDDRQDDKDFNCHIDGLIAADVMEQLPATPCAAATENTEQHPEEWMQKQTKLDKFWPWADRQKIIYKQSTCHLVPKKPLGLIGQRIDQLAKRNLLEHLNPANKSTK